MQGQRVEKKSGDGKKKLWIVLGAAIAVVLAAYTGLCAWVGSTGTIFPNVSIAGLDVSGMTAEQAEASLTQAISAHGEDMVGTVTYNGWRGSITAADMDYTWDLAAKFAYEHGRSNFFLQGGSYLASALGNRHSIGVPRGGSAPALDMLLDQVEREVAGDVTSATYELIDDRLSMTKGRTGVSLDRAGVKDTVLSALEEAITQKLEQDQAGVSEVEHLLIPEELPPQAPDFDAIHTELCREPVSAQMDPNTLQVSDHVVGVDFNIDTLKAAYEQAGEGETFSIHVTLTQPKDTKESLEGKLFRDLLGQGSTTLTGTWGRQYNVKLSAKACDGTILMPGEVFSFNGRTGSRDASMGYQSATVYSGGKTVEEVGGGVCQTSSTIYYALLHTPLEVVQRYNHGYNTGYVPVGMDATVYYGVTDFQFRNNTDYPIRIQIAPEWIDGREKLICRIYGSNEAGVYAVPESAAFDKVPPTTVYQSDETIPQGTTKVDPIQNPYTGLKAQTYRYVYDRDGTLLEKQNMGVSVYKMRPKTILYNPADGDPATWVDGVPPQPQPQPTEPLPPAEPEQPGQVPPAPPPVDPAGEDAQPPLTDGEQPSVDPGEPPAVVA